MVVRLKCRCAVNNITGNGEIVRNGPAIIDKAETSKIILDDNLILGYNLRNGSNIETCLKMHANSILNVSGQFKMFFGSSIEVFEGAELTLARGYINTGGTVACAKSINIGDGVYIGRNTYITDSDHHLIYDGEKNMINKPAPVTICDHVLIGFGAVVLKGVVIGTGSVIGAGSVVTKNIPPYCIAAGNPARVIREGIEWK